MHLYRNVVCVKLFLLMLVSNSLYAGPAVTDNHIKIDQFGYRTQDKKIAVISNPQTGYNSNDHYIPGNVCEIRRWSDDVVVYSGAPVAWNGGSVHSQSGDIVWWFDFSAFTSPGSYYVYDVSNAAGSYRFEINDCVYSDVLKQAMRVFYYQRCGISKAMPFSGVGWTDSGCHIGALQDLDCRLYNNTAATTSKDLSGGWHDAGDYNKYVNFTFETMVDLLLAYSDHPTSWSDDYNIPESGNGIPDLLDEVKYELDWLMKMQNSDGSVLSIVGVSNFAGGSPPSADHNQRVYGPATTSATFTASALFALASVQFQAANQVAYANLLQTRAVSAWNWAIANPGITFYNTGLVGAGEQETDAYGTLQRQLSASAFLFASTGSVTYKTFFENNYSQLHLLQWSYAYPFESAAQDALLFYSSLNGIDPNVRSAIRNAYSSSMSSNNADNLPAYLSQEDAYRAYLSDQNYTWGSNTTKGRQGIMFCNMLSQVLDTANHQNYSDAALGFVNYFHGVNPTAFSYLSNMSVYGAENSINEFYHSWFEDGSALWDRAGTSVYGPAPGYVPGGPNPTYSVDPCCPNSCSSSNALCDAALVTPPLGQPIQKSYKDWNANWPQDSWTITEAGIYTQASYVRLLSNFVSGACIQTGISEDAIRNFSVDVYPNPSDGYVTFSLKQNVQKAELEISNCLGEIVLKQEVKSEHATFDLQILASGMYYYSVRITDNAVAHGKFIMQ